MKKGEDIKAAEARMAIDGIVLKAIKDGGNLAEIKEILLEASSGLARRVAKSVPEISDDVFNSLLSEAVEGDLAGIMEILINRSDTDDERIRSIFRAISNKMRRYIKETGGGVGGKMGKVLNILVEKRLLLNREIEELIGHNGRIRQARLRDNWIIIALNKTVLNKWQILKLLSHEDPRTDEHWVALASQEEADDDVWEVMTRIVAESVEIEPYRGVLWGLILAHPKNRGLNTWKEKWLSVAGKREVGFRIDVAEILLATENLGEEWDIDELVGWWILREHGASSLKLWSQTTRERIGRESKAKLLVHPEKGVRIAAIGLFGPVKSLNGGLAR